MNPMRTYQMIEAGSVFSPHTATFTNVHNKNKEIKTPDQTHDNQTKKDEKSGIFTHFNPRSFRKVNAFLEKIKMHGIVCDDDGKITLPSGKVLKNGIEIIKYLLFSKNKNGKKPLNVGKVVKLLPDVKVNITKDNTNKRTLWLKI